MPSGSITLSPCPFCGKPVREFRGIVGAPFVFFKCTNKRCGALVSFDNPYATTKVTSAEKCWNKRMENDDTFR